MVNTQLVTTIQILIKIAVTMGYIMDSPTCQCLMIYADDLQLPVVNIPHHCVCDLMSQAL